MKKVNVMKKIGFLSLAASLVVASFSALSCDQGLGKAVDTEIPSVKILDPSEQRQGVGKTFSITGETSDNYDINRLEIVLRDKDANIVDKWTFKGGSCKSDSLGELPAEDFSWTKIKDKTYSWNLSAVQLPDSGEYKINAYAYDVSGYGSATSVDTQKSVVYDVQPPQVFVSMPTKRYDTISEIKSNLDSKTTHQEYAMIDQYINGEFTISGTQIENFSLKYLKIWIKDENADVVWKAKVLLTDEKYATEKGVLDEGEDFEVVTSLRSWSVTVPSLSNSENINTLTEKPISEKTYLQIFTKSSDGAGNIETADDGNGNETQILSQGWFCYWPQADAPWTEITLGETASTAYACYPGTNLQGYSYDDDGIESITVTLTDMGTNKETKITLYERGESEPSGYQTWSLIAPTSNGTYKAEIDVFDINGRRTDRKTGYFLVQDVNSPQIKVNSPEQTKTLFGDENGDVVFDLAADDDAEIKKIACVYLNEESDAAKYLNAKDEAWDAVAYNKKTFTDANGNKLWYIDPTYIGEITTDNGGIRQSYSGALKINLFSDLGIDGETKKLSGQHFIFYVSDGGNALSLDYAIQGDIEEPKLTMDKMVVTRKNVSGVEESTEYDLSENPQFDTLQNATITVSGTWSDNSFDAWKDLDKISFTLKWNSSECPVTLNSNGTWVSAPLHYGSTYGGTVVSLQAEIKDYAKNTKKARGSFTVNTETPALQSITSSTPDGSYKAGEDIVIVLKFNKAVTISAEDIAAGLPSLTLNTKDPVTNTFDVVAFDTTSNGTQNLEFKYTTIDKHDIDKLNVSAINANENTFQADGGAASFSLDSIVGKNLANNKNIEIVTTAPIFESASVSGNTLSMKFSAKISKGDGIINITQTDASLTKVPAVLTETEYKAWLKKDANLKNFYTAGTNGASSSGEANLTTKYILNYEYDSNNADLVASYKAAELHKVSVSVKSGAFTIDGMNLNLNLEKFPLPCKGADYEISVPASAVYNMVGTTNEAATKTFTYTGVEAPVIRINKSKWTFDPTTKTATQPLKSEVKIDCETTGATILYGTNESTSNYEAKEISIGASKSTSPYPTATPLQAAPTADTTYIGKFEIGDESWEVGQKIFIAATSTKDGKSEDAFEVAFRSVFVFNEDGMYAGGSEGRILVVDLENEAGTTNPRTDGRVPGVWIRGGDAETGPITTAGFPLNRDESDPKGTALLTKDDTKWYYVTWELTTTAYIEVMAGVSDEDSGTLGPAEWSYGMNAWVPFKKWYCLFPGESRLVNATKYGSVWGQHRGTFGFKKETTDRNNVIRAYNTSGPADDGGGGSDSEYCQKKEFAVTYKNRDPIIATKGQYVFVTFSVDGISNYKKFGYQTSFKNYTDWNGHQQDENGLTKQTITYWAEIPKDIDATNPFKIQVVIDWIIDEEKEFAGFEIEVIDAFVSDTKPISSVETPTVNIPISAGNNKNIKVYFDVDGDATALGKFSKKTAHIIYHPVTGDPKTEERQLSGTNCTYTTWTGDMELSSIDVYCTFEEPSEFIFDAPTVAITNEWAKVKIDNVKTSTQTVNVSGKAGEKVVLKFKVNTPVNFGNMTAYVTCGGKSSTPGGYNISDGHEFTTTIQPQTDFTELTFHCEFSNIQGADVYDEPTITFSDVVAGVKVEKFTKEKTGVAFAGKAGNVPEISFDVKGLPAGFINKYTPRLVLYDTNGEKLTFSDWTGTHDYKSLTEKSNLGNATTSSYSYVDTNWKLEKDISKIDVVCVFEVDGNKTLLEVPDITITNVVVRQQIKSYTTPKQSVPLTAYEGQGVSLSFTMATSVNFKPVTVYVVLKSASGDIVEAPAEQWSDSNGFTYSKSWALTKDITGIEYWCDLSNAASTIYEDPTVTFDAKTKVVGGSADYTDYDGVDVIGYGQTDASGKEILKKEMKFGNKMSIPFKEFATVAEGSQLVISFTFNGWYNLKITHNDAPNNWSDGTLILDAGGQQGPNAIVTITLTAEQAAKLKRTDLVFSGQNCTVTSVKLVNP